MLRRSAALVLLLGWASSLAAAPASDPSGKRAPDSPLGTVEEHAKKQRPLAPGEPVDISFVGCAVSCGVPADPAKQTIVQQPGAKRGDLTYCPVSGAAFPVSRASRTTILAGRPLYFCCGACEKYFSAHRDEVIRLRGL